LPSLRYSFTCQQSFGGAWVLATASANTNFNTMKAQHSNNSHYGLSDFLLVLGAWVLALSLVYLVITKINFLIHSSNHIH